jgi:hypothetical protein
MLHCGEGLTWRSGSSLEPEAGWWGECYPPPSYVSGLGSQADGPPTSLALALLLSRDGPPQEGSVPILITDLPILTPLQLTNIRLNDLPETAIRAFPLPWGSPLPADLPEAYRRPDVILAADCVYFEPAFPLLLETLAELMGPETVCWFCMKKRRKADMRFVVGLRKRFHVEAVRPKAAEGEKGIFL